MGKPPAHVPELCLRFHRASELIGRRWSGAIIYVLVKAPCRFATLRAAIPDITDRMLSERLQELEEEGIVSRTVHTAPPVRVEYELTRKGRALAPAIDAIAEWAQKWIPFGTSATGEPATLGSTSRAADQRGRTPRPRRPTRRRSTA